MTKLTIESRQFFSCLALVAMDNSLQHENMLVAHIDAQLAAAYEQGKKDATTAQTNTQLSTVEIEKGWRDTFSTENPFCPCNLKSFTKAVRWREQAVISLPKEPTE